MPQKEYNKLFITGKQRENGITTLRRKSEELEPPTMSVKAVDIEKKSFPGM